MKNYFRKLLPQLLFLLPCSVFALSFSDKTAADADFVVSVKSIETVRGKLTNHPLSKVAENPKWAFVREMIAGRGEFEGSDPLSEFEATLSDEFNLTVEELFELFSGPVSLSFYGFTEMMINEVGRPEFVLMAEYSGTEEQLDELMKTQFERNFSAHKEMNPEVQHDLLETSFMGETLYLDEVFDGESTYIEDGYALVDGIWILATPEERLRLAVEAVKGAGVETLADLGSFGSFGEETDEGDISMLINFESLTEPLGGIFHDLVGRSGLAMAGVTGQSLEAALALGDLQLYGTEIKIEENGLFADSGLIYREKSGLMSLATYKSGGLPEANYVPNGIFSTSVIRFDVSEMLANLESLLKVASPALAPLLDIQLQNLKNLTGVDLRSSVLENFGSEMVTFTLLPKDADSFDAILQQEQLVVVEIQDAEALSLAIEALIDAFPSARAGFESKVFEGEKIYTVRAPSDDGSINDVSFAVTRNYLMFHQGQVSVLQEAIAAMQSGRGGFWQEPATSELFASLGVEDPIARYYADLGQMIGPIVGPMLGVLAMGGFDVPEIGELPGRSDFPFVVASESYETSDGFFTRMALIFSDEE